MTENEFNEKLNDSKSWFNDLNERVNSKENQENKIYALALAELILEKYRQQIKPSYAIPVGGKDEEKRETNESYLTIKLPNCQEQALLKAYEKNRFLMRVKNDIGSTFYILSEFIDADTQNITRVTITIENTFFNALLKEMRPASVLKEILDDDFMSF